MLTKVGDKKIEVDFNEDWDLECPWTPAPKYSFDAEITIGDNTEHFPYFSNEYPEPGDILYAIAIDAETASEADGFEDFCDLNGLEPDENGDNVKALDMYEKCTKALDFLDKSGIHFSDILDAYDDDELDTMDESLNTHSLNPLFEATLRESSGGLSSEDKNEILKIFRKNDIKVEETSDEYEGGMYCYEVTAGNTNPTQLGYLHDDLYALESRDICFDEDENDEGFYGRTFIFYYLDEDDE